MTAEGASGRGGEPARPGDVTGIEESGLFWRYGLWMLGLGFTCLVLLGTWADVDLRFSRYFYDPEGPQRWFLKTAVPWIWLYRYGEAPTWLLAVSTAVVWCGSRRRRAWVRYRRACALVVLAVALGPGVLVNGALKPLWGRPRPYQVEIFGGSRAYQPWWQPGLIGGGRSFPSGHAAMGYVLVAGTYLVAQRRRPWLRGVVLGGALTYGSLLGLTRIIQGGHFVSDVFWSGSLMCFTVATLHAVLPAMPPTESTPAVRPCSRPVRRGLLSRCATPGQGRRADQNRHPPRPHWQRGVSTMIQLKRLGHVLLKVADVERSRAFYRDLLGFEVVEQDPVHGGVFMSLGEHGHTIDLSPVDDPVTAQQLVRNRLGVHHFAFQVDSFEALKAVGCRRQREAGCGMGTEHRLWT